MDETEAIDLSKAFDSLPQQLLIFIQADYVNPWPITYSTDINVPSRQIYGMASSEKGCSTGFCLGTFLVQYIH